MTRRTRGAIGSVVLLLAGGQPGSLGSAFAGPPGPGVGAEPRADAPGAWLDSPLVNWNQPGGAVPAGPPPEGEPAATLRCEHARRPPTLPEDSAVTGAGWTLFGPAEVFGDVTLVRGMTSVDGMCRPLGYQAFVFVARRFAGTLAPAPMNARTDGALTEVRLFATSELFGEFARYTHGDPLCCPSGTSLVTYRILRGAAPSLEAAAVATTRHARGP